MAKKYLISLNDEQVKQLQTYLIWRENLIYQNTGIKTKTSETTVITQIVNAFLQDLKYSDKK